MIKRLAVIAIMVVVAPLAAQSGGRGRIPPRPRLPRDADTCDAYAYYEQGLALLTEDPHDAAAAFWWAQRLSPATAEPYYAERIALLMDDPSLLRGYVEENARTLASADVRRIDSLQLRALDLDPFFPEQLDAELIVAYFKDIVRADLRAQGADVGESEIDFYVRSAIADADMDTRVWLAFGRGDYREAVDYWGRQERSRRKDAHLRARRAQAYLLLGLPDSALAELDSALAIARRADAERMRYVYDSKARWEYERGRLAELQGRDSAAREAYQRTLVEDLAFEPAHVRLAVVALRVADTAAAIAELQRAVAIDAGEYTSRLTLGALDAARGAADSATAELRRAIEIEPWVALPHLLLAQARETAGDRDGAVAEYRRFLALAARGDPSLDTARQRIAALTAPTP